MQQIITENVELHQKLFDEMLSRFNISAKDLAYTAGISEVMLSRFRRGKADLGMSKFLPILNAVPEEAKNWYVSQLLGTKPKVSLRTWIESAPMSERAEALCVLAEAIAKNCVTTSSDQGIIELPLAV
jgi:hypothetical protein